MRKADIDADGFGGHTALFGTVVSQPNFWVNHLAKPDEAAMPSSCSTTVQM
jgi:hypothetical protein